MAGATGRGTVQTIDDTPRHTSAPGTGVTAGDRGGENTTGAGLCELDAAANVQVGAVRADQHPSAGCIEWRIWSVARVIPGAFAITLNRQVADSFRFGLAGCVVG